jgi:putative addiction module killer protein
MAEIALRQYLDRTGRNPFGEWFDGLHTRAFAKVTIALERLREGNFSNVKGVGSGVYERKIDFGPGYRVYFGKDGDTVVILLAGGTKKKQDRDIASAKACWADYKSRKR